MLKISINCKLINVIVIVTNMLFSRFLHFFNKLNFLIHVPILKIHYL